MTTKKHDYTYKPDKNDAAFFDIKKEKRDFTDMLEQYLSIKNPKDYHKLAYRTGLDIKLVKLTTYLKATLEIQEKIDEVNQKLELSETSDLPDVILDRIADLTEKDPDYNNLSLDEQEKWIENLFRKGNELYGLYKGKEIDNDWLINYLADEEHQPECFNFAITKIMQVDYDKIANRDDITEDEKTKLINALFDEGGKYDGYIRDNWSINIHSIKDKKIREAHTSLPFEEIYDLSETDIETLKKIKKETLKLEQELKKSPKNK